jgi:hypothetical protein
MKVGLNLNIPPPVVNLRYQETPVRLRCARSDACDPPQCPPLLRICK